MRFTKLNDVQHGTNNYVSYFKGDNNSNIILTVPHGGILLPPEITDRDVALKNNNHLTDVLYFSTEGDFSTIELAKQLRENISLLSGKCPHMIIGNIDRKKVDLNRDILEATLNNEDAIVAFREFHSFIEEAKNSVKPRGILFDIHGQSHPEKWVELGYCVNLDDKENIRPQCSSIKLLASESQTQFQELLYGDKSLGRLLQDRNVKAIPSPQFKAPRGGNYYWGGYNSKTHGSKNGGHVDAIQIESPGILRKPQYITSYAKTLAEAIVCFVDMHYNNQ